MYLYSMRPPLVTGHRWRRAGAVVFRYRRTVALRVALELRAHRARVRSRPMDHTIERQYLNGTIGAGLNRGQGVGHGQQKRGERTSFGALASRARLRNILLTSRGSPGTAIYEEDYPPQRVQPVRGGVAIVRAVSQPARPHVPGIYVDAFLGRTRARARGWMLRFALFRRHPWRLRCLQGRLEGRHPARRAISRQRSDAAFSRAGAGDAPSWLHIHVQHHLLSAVSHRQALLLARPFHRRPRWMEYRDLVSRQRLPQRPGGDALACS